MRSICSVRVTTGFAAREAHVDVEILLLDRRAAAAGDGDPIAVGLAIGGRGGAAAERHVDFDRSS